MIWLVRHPPVAMHWQKRCYGVSDMGLSREGARMATILVSRLVQLSPDAIVHSDMLRTRGIAERAAKLLSIEAQADPLWRERNFGSWEGRSWHAIYRETGNAMDGMLSDPIGFRPGGGETTAKLVSRSVQLWHDLARDKNIAVIAHGGPIAAILADKNAAAFHLLPDYIPEPGSITKV